MLKVSITGGIGTGKTTVARLFELLGIPVYYSDERAKLLMNTNKELVDSIIALFGEQAYTNGILNRKHISAQVFTNPDLLEKLNGIVHPAVFADQATWFTGLTAPYVLFESAIIYEINRADSFDYVIVVDAPEELRIARTTKRDGVDEKAIRKRMASQLPQKQKVDKADFVIQNNNVNSLIKQVMNIHQQLMDKASN